ncbi:tetratricopeptide repeat protein [Sandaracinobacteroides hominis]|uniref:tetratricopeptide repeat protein n=1 Tax=Sandaracinobacteroides hominis TaxID=2780086 RepID=UPI0018F3E9E4|nr:tetratricopeptide repeat protein [Sandaracinobacteroides hominis]
MISRSLFVVVLLSSTGMVFAQTPPASQAQVSQIDKRVGTLESQMRAVQRQVFPGGDKRFFAPEVTVEPQPVTPAGTPATAPLVDLTQRVEALENQQRQLTGQVETLQFQMRQLEEAMKKFRGDTEFRLDALEGKGPAAATTAASASVPAPAATPVVVPTPQKPAAAKPAPATVPPAAAAPAPPTTDAAEAQYRAGYQLYVDGKYAEAATALNQFVTESPKHARASNAQFWAGRSLLAQGKTADAAKAFLAGYQKYPRGERAHNSLLWLGKSLIELKQPKAACQALDQLKTAYPDKLTGQFAADATAARAQAKCGS